MHNIKKSFRQFCSLYGQSFSEIWQWFGAPGIVSNLFILLGSLAFTIAFKLNVTPVAEEFWVSLIVLIFSLLTIPLLSFINLFGVSETREVELRAKLNKWEGEGIYPDLLFLPVNQNDGHLGIRITNMEDWNIDNCSAELTSLTHQKYKNLDSFIGDAKFILEDVNPNGLPLTWGGGSEGGRRSISRDGGQGLLNIARHYNERLVFLFHGLHGEMKSERQEQGIYEFEVWLDGTIQGKSIEDVTVKGEIEFRRFYKDQDGNTYSSDGVESTRIYSEDQLIGEYYYSEVNITLFD